MFHTMLVPLDGSSLAERALPYAAALAHAGSGRLLLFQAVQRDAERDSDGETAVHEANSYLAEVKSSLAAMYGLGRIETSVAVGEAASAIVEMAGECYADAIVMGTHGRSGLGRWLYGSVADAVLRHAPVPVLLVPAACERLWGISPPGGAGQASRRTRAAPAGAAGHPRRILVPLDGSELALEALPAARGLAAAFGAELLLLQVVDLAAPAYSTLYPWLAPDPGPALVDAQRSLDAVAASLCVRGCQVTTLAETGSPVPTIAALARERQVDLIVMATHGRGGVTRLALGSVATDLLQQSPVPLLLVRPIVARVPVADAAPAAPAASTTLAPV